MGCPYPQPGKIARLPPAVGLSPALRAPAAGARWLYRIVILIGAILETTHRIYARSTPVMGRLP